MIVKPEDILDFWFVQSGPKRWFKKSDAFDAEIRLRFEDTTLSLATNIAEWDTQPESSLALIIALDQFPRNMYRATKAAFAFDEAALQHAKVMTDRGWDLKIDQSRRAFVYMPFMHAENMTAQNESVRLIDMRLEDANTLHHAKEHRKVIERFGRFPHRNAILGRESTAEEIAFLKSGGYAP
ncbi:DUF924 family protein [Hellea balneolensis]|uniref:DUF924 family protein n=1 Tax=Hellea balneolensis TaxID=287478 RepID=UPI0012B75AA2|nr:DUF924 family protein [Hellea balneolensis]